MANWFLSEWKLWLLVLLVLDCFIDAQTLKPTRWPLYQGKPLLLAWNAPTEDCWPRHKVPLQLDQFHIVASPNEGFTKQNLTIFYKDRLGLYPYFNSDNNPVNGGLPQIASLTAHLEKMPQDIKKYIHNSATKGLAVIDWEEWRPLWIRNWDMKSIYKNQSMLLVSKKNPTWDQGHVMKVAQQEFEMSGRNFMLRSLQLAKSLRPNQFWGFYLFPDCYNHDYLKSLESYTGRCPDPEIARNEQLRWLWTESTALFPSVYIGSVLRSTAFARQFVRYRVKEGMRVASLDSELARPVFVYARPTYINELELLTEIDLVSTIGESVALGAAGIILWGDASYASSPGMGTVATWTWQIILLCIFLTCPIMSRPMLLSEFPFFTVWNAPTEKCVSQYGVDLDLSTFDIIHNKNQSFIGSNITILYSDKLGFYPHYTDKNESVYGGVPQNFSLNKHLLQAYADLQKNIPDKNFTGLAVVDWESWRPLWDRNWDRKEVYQEGSRTLVRAKHHDWKPKQIEAQAKKDFEGAAQNFMEKTIKLGRTERPGGLWGFYGFPCCYNYQYKKNETYTGKCPPLDMMRNDKLSWLWNVSTALYPDIYIDLSLKGRDRDILLYARHRIQEGMRISKQVFPIQPLVIPYARIVYTYSMTFLSQEDLVHTIGESVALGAAGVVLWGDAVYSTNKGKPLTITITSTCLSVKSYIDETLGRYLVNATKAALLCSKELCSFNGRCVRQDAASSAYLHLDPAVWTIIPRAELPDQNPNRPSYVIQMKNKEEGYYFTKLFKCQCYPGWEGEHCEKQIAPKPRQRK
ncbi:hypothetical protein QTP86_019690 [Hemibagrus guttatus]|nr:hypothetical protein QTP86_019690 [Hemibagrus guttatus]